MIGIIDYGSGNFASVFNAFKTLTDDIIVVTEKSQLKKCSHIVLPGVGSFGSAIAKLQNMQIIEALHECVMVDKIPFLGICVGMQLLAEKGYEFGEHAGLGYVKGCVKKLEIDTEEYPLPHMGWNDLKSMQNSPLFKGIDNDANFYFVHGYHFEVEDKNIKTVNVVYGKEFVAAFSIENIHGVQFHPEKSQYYGLQLLKNFIRL